MCSAYVVDTPDTTTTEQMRHSAWIGVLAGRRQELLLDVRRVCRCVSSLVSSCAQCLVDLARFITHCDSWKCVQWLFETDRQRNRSMKRFLDRCILLFVPHNSTLALVIRAIGQKFHANCLKCSSCGTVLGSACFVSCLMCPLTFDVTLARMIRCMKKLVELIAIVVNK